MSEQKFAIGERVFLLMVWKITGANVYATVLEYDEETEVYTVRPDGARYGDLRCFEWDLSKS